MVLGKYLVSENKGPDEAQDQLHVACIDILIACGEWIKFYFINSENNVKEKLYRT